MIRLTVIVDGVTVGECVIDRSVANVVRNALTQIYVRAHTLEFRVDLALTDRPA